MQPQTPSPIARENRIFISYSERDVERGARRASNLARQAYGQWLWAFRNLPKNHFEAVCGLLTVVHLGEEAINSRGHVSKTEAPCDELKEDLSDAFSGRFASTELMFITYVVDHWHIPKQFIFEPLEAFDRLWRFGQPKTYPEALATATRLGGGLLRQLIHVLEPEKPEFESATIKTGQALALAWWLWQLVDDAAQGRTIRLPSDDLASSQIDMELLRGRRQQKSLHHFVRLYAHRIDQLLNEGGSLFQHLGYDGQRVLKTILGICWRGMCNIRLDPDRLMQAEQALGEREFFALRARHFLGLDAALPFGKVQESH